MKREKNFLILFPPILLETKQKFRIFFFFLLKIKKKINDIVKYTPVGGSCITTKENISFSFKFFSVKKKKKELNRLICLPLYTQTYNRIEYISNLFFLLIAYCLLRISKPSQALERKRVKSTLEKRERGSVVLLNTD